MLRVCRRVVSFMSLLISYLLTFLLMIILFDRWSDIVGFSRNRKLFGIDTTLSVKPFQFQLVSFLTTTCYVHISLYR